MGREGFVNNALSLVLTFLLTEKSKGGCVWGGGVTENTRMGDGNDRGIVERM